MYLQDEKRAKIGSDSRSSKNKRREKANIVLLITDDQDVELGECGRSSFCFNVSGAVLCAMRKHNKENDVICGSLRATWHSPLPDMSHQETGNDTTRGTVFRTFLCSRDLAFDFVKQAARLV